MTLHFECIRTIFLLNRVSLISDFEPGRIIAVKFRFPSMMNARRIIITLLGLCCLIVSHSNGQTLSPQKVMGRYQQFVWTDQHGLPQSTVQAITRTRDGYLWLGTLAGAPRFDGVRFTVFDNANTVEIKENFITALLEDRRGNLWLGTDGGGLCRFKDGRFTTITAKGA